MNQLSPLPEVTLPETGWRVLTHADARYILRVAWPSDTPPPAGFPVIYLLDAAVSFATTVECVRARSHRPDATAVPPAVVVGLSLDSPRDHQRRTWDFTPADLSRPDDDEVPAGTAIGGANALLDFLATDVVASVEREWPIDPTRRTLLGHSLSAFFVLHALFARPTLFEAYVAASPSIWWDPTGVTTRAAALARNPPQPVPRVLLTAGEYEQAPAPWQPPGSWTAEAIARRQRRQMVSHVTRLGETLAPLATRGGVVRTLVFPGEDHASVVPLTINQALRFGPGRV
jgi:predicted alpha/beta superfamily hydrolase